VRAGVETIVIALNERREWKKSKVRPKDRRKAAAVARAADAATT